MLRWPSELTHVRPLTRRRQVGAARPRCAARVRRRRRSISTAWKARRPPQRRTGSGWSRNSARQTKASKLAQRHARLLRVGLRRPQRRAPAPLAASARGSAARARLERARRSGSMPGQRARVLRAPGSRGSPWSSWPPTASGRCSRPAASPARGGSSPRSDRAARRAGAASRCAARIARCSSSSSGAASVVERTITSWRSSTSRQ